jgi:hypothetical protein
MSLRIEKGYGSWSREYSPEYWPQEAGLAGLCKMDKEFLNKAALEAVIGEAARERLQALGYDVAVTIGDGAGALAQIEPHLPIAEASENAALLATLMLLKAEALEIEGRGIEARRVRLDSIGWARYGFGPDWAVRAKLREIASLNPRNG